MQKNLMFATVVVALVGAGMFIACSGDSPTAPETDVAYQPTVAPTAAGATVPGGFTAAVGQGKADPPPTLCEDLTGKDRGHCVAWFAQNCDVTPDRNSCQQIIKNYAGTPPWLAEFWPDADGDGFGDSTAGSRLGSTAPDGYADNNADCSDADAGINPGAEEVCDGLDNNCNGAVDEGDVCVACPCFSAEDLLAVGDGETQICAAAGGGFELAGTDEVTGFYERALAQSNRACFYRVAGQPYVKILSSPEEWVACYNLLEAECAARGF